MNRSASSEGTVPWQEETTACERAGIRQHGQPASNVRQCREKSGRPYSIDNYHDRKGPTGRAFTQCYDAAIIAVFRATRIRPAESADIRYDSGNPAR